MIEKYAIRNDREVRMTQKEREGGSVLVVKNDDPSQISILRISIIVSFASS